MVSINTRQPAVAAARPRGSFLDLLLVIAAIFCFLSSAACFSLFVVTLAEIAKNAGAENELADIAQGARMTFSLSYFVASSITFAIGVICCRLAR